MTEELGERETQRMDAWVTILTALLAAIVGGWVGASSQFRTERRLRSLDLIWDFRLHLGKTERSIWDEQKWPEFHERVRWVEVAASDPRIDLGPEKVEVFIQAVLAAKKFNEDREPGVLNPGEVSKGEALLEEMDRAREALDKLAIERLRKLA